MFTVLRIHRFADILFRLKEKSTVIKIDNPVNRRNVEPPDSDWGVVPGEGCPGPRAGKATLRTISIRCRLRVVPSNRLRSAGGSPPDQWESKLEAQDSTRSNGEKREYQTVSFAAILLKCHVFTNELIPEWMLTIFVKMLKKS